MHVDFVVCAILYQWSDHGFLYPIELFLEVYTNRDQLRKTLCSAKGREWLGEGLIRLASTSFETGDAY